MKQIHLLILSTVLSISIQSNAQLNYSFSATTKPYVPVTAGTTPHLITDYSAWKVEDEGFARVPIGFTFNYDGENYTHANIDVNGFITLKDSLNIFYNYPYFRNSLATAPPYYKRPVIAAFWDDLLLADTLDLVYKTTGHAPFRIFTVEWKKAKWVFESLAPVFSIELKLYETTNIIEFHYKDEGGFPDPRYAFASIGISSSYANRGFISLQNTSSHPDISMLKAMDSLTVKPADNQVYRFIPLLVKIPPLLENSIRYTNNSVSFNLNTGGFNWFGSYEYAITHSPLPPVSGINTFLPEVTVSALSPATTYYIYARSKWFNWFNSQWTCDSFTTAMNPVAQPYHISGDPATGILIPSAGSIIPFDMRQQNLSDTNIFFSSANNGWSVLFDFPHIGDTSLWDLNFDAYDADDWIFTPPIKLFAGKKYQVKFGYQSYYVYNVGDPASIEVKYGKATGAAAMSKTLFAKMDIRSYDDYDEFGSLPLTDTVIEIIPGRTDNYYFGFHNLSLLTDGVPIIGNFSVSEKISLTENSYVLNGRTNNNNNVFNWSANVNENNATVEMQRSSDGINFTKLDEISRQQESAKNKSTLSIIKNQEAKAFENIKDKHSEVFNKIIHHVEIKKSNADVIFRKSKDVALQQVKSNPDFVDRNVNGLYYYRIQKKDSHGKASYSNIVALNNNNVRFSLKVYPNPAGSLLNVQIPIGKNKEMILVVRDATGRTVFTKSLHGSKEEGNVQLDVSHLNSGTYFLTVTCESGCENAAVKFEKN